MRVASACLSVCFLFAPDIFVTGSGLKSNQYRRDGEACNMCYLDQCWSLELARCEYYLLSDHGTYIEQGGITTQVDNLMYQLVDEAVVMDIGRDCIPFITYYTDCQKENACLGCKSCTCDSGGRWNCVEEQHCRSEVDVLVDHRVLKTVIETLGYNKDLRRRRSLPTSETLATSKFKKISYEQLAEWMYGVKPSLQMNFKSIKPETSATNQYKSEIQLKQAKKKKQNHNIDYMDLDDVLNTIDLPNNKRRKAKLDEKSFDSRDDGKEEKNVKIVDDFLDIFNLLGSKTDGIETSTKVIIDLLVTSNKNGSYNFLSRDIYNIKKETNKDSFLGLLNGAKNIMKRQVPVIPPIGTNQTKTSYMKHDANTTVFNDSNVNVHSLTEDVLNPINNIISEKEKEIKYLFKVKENLQSFIKTYNDTEINHTMQNNTKISNDSFSIYKLDIFPEVQYNLRKINPNNIDKLLYKLKRDIYEVVKDISGIQKISKTRDLPDDLRALIEAMKFYIHNKNSKNKTKNSQKEKDKDALKRRANFYTATPIANQLINLLTVIDENKLNKNHLTSITPSSRKIIKRVVKNYYYDESLNNGLQIYDPEYNLTNNLREIGVNWNRYVEILDYCDSTEVIYAMKLLHYGISSDIVKITDALTLVTFAYSRRMVPVEGRTGEQITDEIINGLRTINDKIKYYVHFNKQLEKHEKHEVQKTKKQSFLKKIKNLFKGAKTDIGHLFRSKLSQSEIVNNLAKKNFDELNRDDQAKELENTMKRWQNNLHIMRKKRSMNRMEKLRSRLTNILPKYLRGKLNPAIDAKKKKAKAKKVNGMKNEDVKKPGKRTHTKPTTVKHKLKHTTKLPKTAKHTTSKPNLRSKSTSKPKKITKILDHLRKKRTTAKPKPKPKPTISDVLNDLTKGL